MSEPVFLTALLIAGATIVMVAGRIRSPRWKTSRTAWRTSHPILQSFRSAWTLRSGCWPRVAIGQVYLRIPHDREACCRSVHVEVPANDYVS
jgi:hypothetical protein